MPNHPHRADFARYLRVSVTDRCNFRCRYCMPDGTFQALPHGEILRYEEILRLARVAAAAGVAKLRVTGGEPLVRRDLLHLVGGLARLDGIREVCLTTNGTLLPRFAAGLKAAGLSRVTVSLDSLRPERFREITGGGRLEDVLRGIDAALAAGLTPLKINVVALRGRNDDEIGAFADLARRLDVEVRFIEYMPLGGNDWKEAFLPAREVEARIRDAAGASLDPLPPEGAASRRFALPGAGRLGLITPLSAPFCAACDRLRLTAPGFLRSCLIAGGEVDVKTPLRAGAGDEVLSGLLREAWALKPAGHGLDPGRPEHHPLDCQGMRPIGG